MGIFNDLQMYYRYAAGLRLFLNTPVTLGKAKRLIRRLDEQRTDHFLRIVRHGIFNNTSSPYRAMLTHAGISRFDIEAMVHRHGLEKTLGHLYQEGIYISFEEFKGRKPIIRGNMIIHPSTPDFFNPFVSKHYYTESGGSTGAGTRVPHDLDFLAVQSIFQLLAHHAHGVLDAPTALWRGILPDGSGINNILRMSHFGQTPVEWFAPNGGDPLEVSLLKYRVASNLTVLFGRGAGKNIPWPKTVPLDKPEVVANWAKRMIDRNGSCLILTPASRGLRVAMAAEKAGFDLHGATFGIAGEPITPPKVEGIRRTGAKVFTTYGFAETGRIAMGCAKPVNATDLHVFTGMCAMIPQRIIAPGTNQEVSALSVTSIHPSAPFILLNMLSDDYGVIEYRECGCPLGELGFTTHLRDVSSYGKLTVEGTTLIGSDMTRILEEVLPSNFGGTSLDYQLLEEEDKTGFSRLYLVVSPRIKIKSDRAVIDKVLRHLEKDTTMSSSTGKIWRQANSIQLKRMEPVWTERGKFYSIRKYEIQ